MKIKCFPLKLFGVNTYVVWDAATKQCAIIDPGMIDDEDNAQIDSFIADNGLKVTHLIYTHAHLDHVTGSTAVSSKYGVKAMGNSDDDMLAQRVKQQAAMFGLPGNMFENCSIDTNLKDGDVVKIGDGELHVLQVPGHSPGSIALYDKQDGWVITGDALFEGSIGRTDLPGGNHSQLINSIKTKLLTLPGDTVVYPGHGERTTIDNEQRFNPFLR